MSQDRDDATSKSKSMRSLRQLTGGNKSKAKKDKQSPPVDIAQRWLDEEADETAGRAHSAESEPVPDQRITGDWQQEPVRQAPYQDAYRPQVFNNEFPDESWRRRDGAGQSNKTNASPTENSSSKPDNFTKEQWSSSTAEIPWSDAQKAPWPDGEVREESQDSAQKPPFEETAPSSPVFLRENIFGDDTPLQTTTDFSAPIPRKSTTEKNFFAAPVPAPTSPKSLPATGIFMGADEAVFLGSEDAVFTGAAAYWIEEAEPHPTGSGRSDDGYLGADDSDSVIKEFLTKVLAWRTDHKAKGITTPDQLGRLQNERDRSRVQSVRLKNLRTISVEHAPMLDAWFDDSAPAAAEPAPRITVQEASIYKNSHEQQSFNVDPAVASNHPAETGVKPSALGSALTKGIHRKTTAPNTVSSTSIPVRSALDSFKTAGNAVVGGNSVTSPNTIPFSAQPISAQASVDQLAPASAAKNQLPSKAPVMARADKTSTTVSTPRAADEAPQSLAEIGDSNTSAPSTIPPARAPQHSTNVFSPLARTTPDSASHAQVGTGLDALPVKSTGTAIDATARSLAESPTTKSATNSYSTQVSPDSPQSAKTALRTEASGTTTPAVRSSISTAKPFNPISSQSATVDPAVAAQAPAPASTPAPVKPAGILQAQKSGSQTADAAGNGKSLHDTRDLQHATHAAQAVQETKELFAAVQIGNSLRNLQQRAVRPENTLTSIPSLPRFAGDTPGSSPVLETNVPSMPSRVATAPVQEVVPRLSVPTKSPYGMLTDVMDADSQSSKWLQSNGLLQKFMASDCSVDTTMNSDGAVSSVLVTPDGYKRTIVCRPDGSISQRVSAPGGMEIVRFSASGEPVVNPKWAK